MPCCEISDCAQMSKTIIAVRHFGLGGRESLETAVNLNLQESQKLSPQQGTTTALFMIFLHSGQKYSGGIGFSLSARPA